MAELRSVAAERDSFKEGRANLVAVLATSSAERDKAQIECCEANARADFADLSAERRGAELEKLRSELNQILATASGQPLDRINQDTDRDFYLNAQEAIAYGLADRIVDTV